MPMTSIPRLFLLLLSFGATPALAQNPWAKVSAPSAGRPEAIGGYAAGCVAGAVSLPLSGDGYQVMRPGRNRFYGHPKLVSFVERLAERAGSQGLGRLLVGDLSQPRGGPAAYGHASHQSGLDVDIWFRLLHPDAAPLKRQQTEQLPMESVIRAAEGMLDKVRWDRRYADLLRLAATSPEVDRIFVNPVIKRSLCGSGERGDWLGKLRPWWGHDQHFHVRLRCPADSLGCETQKPIPAGDGCDEDLDGWVREIQLAAKRPKPTPPDRSGTRLPSACNAVLADASVPDGQAVARAGQEPAAWASFP